MSGLGDLVARTEELTDEELTAQLHEHSGQLRGVLVEMFRRILRGHGPDGPDDGPPSPPAAPAAPQVPPSGSGALSGSQSVADGAAAFLAGRPALAAV